MSKFSCQRDGLTIRGLCFMPEGTNLPVAVMSHEFMTSYDFTKKYAQWFAERGYAAFCFDFCGGSLPGRSDGTTMEMTVFTEVEDLKAVIEYAWSLPQTQSGTVTLLGCSQGGLVSTFVAAEWKERVRRLILFYPGFSATDDLKRGTDFFRDFDPNDIADVIHYESVPISGEFFKAIMNVDLFGIISQYDGEVLIVHCTGDPLVNFHYSEVAKDTFPNARLKAIMDEQHVFSGGNVDLALSYVDEFINEQK